MTTVGVSEPRLQQRIYERLCLAGAIVVGVVSVPTNILQGLPWLVTLLAAVFGALSLGFYLASRRGFWYPAAYLGLMLVVINLIWFPNGGVLGSTPYFLLPAAAYAVIFFRGGARVAWVTGIALDATALGLAELWRPALVTAYPSLSAHVIDTLAGFGFSLLLTALMLWVVSDGYDEERRQNADALGALDEARADFVKLFQMNPDAVYLMDPAVPAYVEVNHGFEKLTGWTRPEVTGRTPAELALWAEPDEHQAFNDELAARGHVQGFLSRFRRRGGEIFWGATSASGIEMGGRRLLLLSTRDVTHRIEAQRRESEARAQLAALLDSTDDGIWLVEPTRFAFTAFNAAFVERFRLEWGVEPVIGQSLDGVIGVPGGIAATWREYYERAMSSGAFTTEFTFQRGERTSLVSLNPVRVGPDILGVSVFSRDITRLKRESAERSAVQQQMLQSQKLESLGTLAGGVAHDFNNMLAGILGYAELLLDGETAPVRRRYLDSIIQAAHRSSELTRNLLAFGRRGKNIVQAVDIAAVTRDVLTMLRPTFRSDVEVGMRMDGVWTVDADPSQMTQMLVNLCINANEAMPHGGQLQVLAQNTTLDTERAAALGLAAGAFVELRVVDWGVGMSGDTRARVFEPFFTTKRGGQVRGTGLGLSTVYGIVQAHGGAIGVESTPGVGTAFTIHLPKGRLSPERHMAPRPAPAGSGVILVVEDETMVREVIESALTNLGYKVVSAVDGEDAMRVYTEHRHRITGVVLDLKMPKKGGVEVFREIHALDPHVAVLICSGYGDNEEAQSLISQGARGLLAKPFHMSELAARLADLH